MIMFLISVGCCFGQQKAQEISGAWVITNPDWQNSEFHANQKWASAKVLCFFRDGRFGIVGGTLHQTDDQLEISYGDSQTVYFGSWKRTGNEITITYRVIYRDIQTSGSENESTMLREQLVVNEEGEILFQSQRFKKEPRLDKSAEFTISEKLPHRKSQARH
jgi:hypothetical protein